MSEPPRYAHCIKCWRPINGWGMVCIDCQLGVRPPSTGYGTGPESKPGARVASNNPREDHCH